MRWVLAALFSIAAFACTEHGKGGGVFCFFMGQTHAAGDQFAAGDGCNFCTCDVDGQVQCSTDPCGDGGLDDAPNACGPSGVCANGPQCGGLCCGAGENCSPNSATCTCGGN